MSRNQIQLHCHNCSIKHIITNTKQITHMRHLPVRARPCQDSYVCVCVCVKKSEQTTNSRITTCWLPCQGWLSFKKNSPSAKHTNSCYQAIALTHASHRHYQLVALPRLTKQVSRPVPPAGFSRWSAGNLDMPENHSLLHQKAPKLLFE